VKSCTLGTLRIPSFTLHISLQNAMGTGKNYSISVYGELLY
jgi:hypothetical protein